MLQEFISINIEEIKEEQITSVNQYKIGKQVLYNPSKQNTYYDCWKWRHDYITPGISDANIVALLYTIQINTDAALDEMKLKKILSQYFINEFGDKNVLYISFDNSNELTSYCYALTYPLSKRILNPRLWTFHNKMVGQKELKFFEYIEYEFGLIEKVSDKDKYIKIDDRLLEDMTIQEYTTSLPIIQADMPYDDLLEKFKITYAYFSNSERRLFNLARRYEVEASEFLEKVVEYLNNTHPDLTNKDKEFILSEMYNAVYAYYKLTPLINDPKISDIKVININNIRVKVGGVRYTSNIKFDSRQDYYNFVESIAYRNNIDLNVAAMSHFVDKTGSDDFLLRFNITTTYVASSINPYIHIRKVAKTKPTMNKLIEDGMLTKELALWLIKQAKCAGGLSFVGQGGSGKTTLMNVLLEYIPYGCSAMCVQDNEELFSDNHPDIMFVHTVEAQGNGIEVNYPVYDLKDISKNGLLADIDYFIIGETKGAEALYLLNASMTGAKCWTSAHSGKATLDKIADYIMYESKYNRRQALERLRDMSYVIHMDSYKVMDIARVGNWNEELDDLEYTCIYQYGKGFLE